MNELVCYLGIILIGLSRKYNTENNGRNTAKLQLLCLAVTTPKTTETFWAKLELSHFYSIESLRDRLSHNYAKVKRKSNAQCQISFNCQG